MRFSSVVGYHMQPLTCGVAKFNTLLAKRLGVPFVANIDTEHWGDFPLLSLKWSELHKDHQTFTRSKCWPDKLGNSMEVALTLKARRYGVFWHDAGDATITAHAEQVFYADPSLGSPGLWCPSLLTPSVPRTVRLFSFGMASKLQPHRYQRVREQLDAAGLDYRLRVSVGLHEGTSLADATQHFDALREIMGHDKVTILGILSDDAVAEELREADAVLAFFATGARANNTTIHAGLEARRAVITNHDPDTPLVLRSMTKDVNRPEWVENLRRKKHPYSWDALMVEIEKICEASKLAPA